MPITSKLTYAVAFQVGWFICILGGNFFSFIYTFIFLTAHFWYLFHNKKMLSMELLWVFLIFSSGLILETISFSSSFLYSISSTSTNPFKHLIIPPLWLLNLWILFAIALRTCLSFIFTKPILSYLMAFIAIPINYYAGAELNGNVFINRPYMLSLALITLMWVLFLWLLIKLKNSYFEDIFNAH